MTLDESIEIERPTGVVYARWIGFEQFPTFMRGVNPGGQPAGAHLHWSPEATKAWFPMIVEKSPDKNIAWWSVAGGVNFGRVEFTAVEPSLTWLNLRVAREPEDPLKRLAYPPLLDSRAIECKLGRFKSSVESEDNSNPRERTISPDFRRIQMRLDSIVGALF